MPRATENLEQRVVKKFSARFKTECKAFSQHINGISDKDAAQWHACILLVRLMFVYFIQAKGWPTNDPNYWRSAMAESKRRGCNRFYREFCGLVFADGVANKSDTRAATAYELLGNAPGLDNLFAHVDTKLTSELSIQIPDVAFERVFDFFDEYGWRLEDGPPADERDITPAVLGCLLEQHINQRQTGAYYTKDDISAHLARYIIIPSLFDAVEHESPRAFAGEHSIWRLVQADPDRYIYLAVRKGADLPLPAAIASAASDGAARARVNLPALDGYGLPTETGREICARRARYEALRTRLANGEIHHINDFITYNLDIRRFAEDVIATCDSAELLLAFWHALDRLTVLDPTCGSGAFLFAALNTLEPLYTACLNRMRIFFSAPCDPAIRAEFRRILDQMRFAAPPSHHRYVILKTIITCNLFGVDLMPEAVEMCRLRLLLKLLVYAESAESLPCLSRNIRVGNALVGCAVRHGTGDRRDLDRQLASECSVDARDQAAYANWLASHQPFHWAIEFPEIIGRGGFDCIIGNPPYVSAAKIRKQYAITNYATARCPDVYAWVLERACALLARGGRSGMVVPLSLTFSGDFASCRRLLFASFGENWFASFARIPAALFNFDVRIRNTIHLGHKSAGANLNHTTRLHRWFEAARPHLFELIEYAPFTPAMWQHRIPKLNTQRLSEAFERCLQASRARIASSLVAGPTPHVLHFKKTAYNWLNFCRRLPPCYDRTGASIPHTKFSTVYFAAAHERDLAFLLLNGKLMLAFWAIVGDDFDVTRWMFADFPIDLAVIPSETAARLLLLVNELEAVMDANISFKQNAGKRVGSYNLARCRAVTDQSDRVFAAQLGIADAWPDVELLYDQIVKTNHR